MDGMRLKETLPKRNPIHYANQPNSILRKGFVEALVDVLKKRNSLIANKDDPVETPDEGKISMPLKVE